MFGRNNVKFASKYFEQLKLKSAEDSYDHYMAFVVVNNECIERYIVDFRDKISIKVNAYNWCSKYAKVNYLREATESKFQDKIISIPPGFGIRVWSLYQSAYYCFVNFFRNLRSLPVPLKYFVGDYYAQYKRPRLEEYYNHKIKNSSNPYIFMVATLWDHKNCIETTNKYRREFIQICQSLDVEFEGGFVAEQSHPEYEDYKPYIMDEKYSYKEFVSRTLNSWVVFNTPSVHNCHGWKLGEYMAMGKAIISSPLSNDLPGDFKNNRNIHIVNDAKELKIAVKRILADNSYRNKLQSGAFSYYQTYGSPQAVIKALIQ